MTGPDPMTAEQLLNAAYRERAHLVALLAAVYPAEFRENPDADYEDWPIVYVQLPTGQASWHISPNDMDLFSHVKFGTEAEWDGHTTDEKYARIRHLTAQTHAASKRGADNAAALEPMRAAVRRFTDAVVKRDEQQPDPAPTDGWILWDSEGRWMHTTTFTTTTDANRRDDGWRAVSINEAEANEFRSKGCILDRLDSTGWRAFAQLRGTLRAGGSRDQWLAKCAEPGPLDANAKASDQ